MTAPQASPRPFHEIPNPQVLDAADQFYAGYRTLFGQLPGSGVLLPALHCASIGIELYLKSLSAREVEVSDADPAEGVYIIYAKSAARSHKFEDLFDRAPEEFQQTIEASFQQKPRLQKYGGVRSALLSYNAIFMASRYPFEAGQTFDNIEMGALSELLVCLSNAIRSATPRHVPDVPPLTSPVLG